MKFTNILGLEECFLRKKLSQLILNIDSKTSRTTGLSNCERKVDYLFVR